MEQDSVDGTYAGLEKECTSCCERWVYGGLDRTEAVYEWNTVQLQGHLHGVDMRE